MFISLVVPCYNEEAAITLFYEEAVKICTSLNEQYEIIFIDDGSTDNTLSILRQLVNQNNNIHYISFSRNFGKEAAMLAGLEASQGEYIVMLDADLQHPPSLILQMLKEVVSDNYDCVVAKRTRKGDPRLHSFFAKCFYRMASKISGIELIDGAGDFRLMTKSYVNALLQLGERNRFLKGIYPWIGFRTKFIEYENAERIAGKTKWSLRKLFLYSLDGIFAFSSKPLAIASVLGILLFIATFLIISFIIVRKIIWGDPVSGWASTVCIILFCSGVQLFTIGIFGQYMAKIYTEVKQRPQYIIRELK